MTKSQERSTNEQGLKRRQTKNVKRLLHPIYNIVSSEVAKRRLLLNTSSVLICFQYGALLFVHEGGRFGGHWVRRVRV